MKHNIKVFLQKASPFLITIALWRLSVGFWNPAGVLAMIPVFYCSFVLHIYGFTSFSFIICFLIDYKFNLPLFWTIMYSTFYAVNGFQNFIDLATVPKNANVIFLIFFGVAMFILTLLHFSVANILNALWTIAWVGALYFPLTSLIKRLHND